jgi:pyruvate/2-oxoglutarate dehydrogenase complex dihydrolipoamide acyltransferase (E2) component
MGVELKLEAGAGDYVTVTRWLKKEGDAVAAGEVVVEVDLDKVTAELGAPVSGTLRTIIVLEGEEVRASEPLGVIEEA